MSESTSPHTNCTVLDSVQIMELRPAQLMSRNWAEIYSFIAQVLNMVWQEGAYGVVLAGVLAEDAIHDMLVFGFPDPGMINTKELTPPDGIPLFLRTDWIVPVIGPADWYRQAVQFHDLQGLKRVSLGVEGNIHKAAVLPIYRGGHRPI